MLAEGLSSFRVLGVRPPGHGPANSLSHRSIQFGPCRRAKLAPAESGNRGRWWRVVAQKHLHQHKPGSFGANEGFYRSAAVIRLTAGPEVGRKRYLLLPHPREDLADGMPIRHGGIAAIDLLMTVAAPPVGYLLRTWRQRRRRSQLALACDAEISQRHLSFIESGRASPSREMVLHLAEQLDVSHATATCCWLRWGWHRFIGSARRTIQHCRPPAKRIVLKDHEPYPALAVDRHWLLVAVNRAVSPLLTDVGPELLQPPVNVLGLSLHPAGLAPRIVNLAQWREHILTRLSTPDAELTCSRTTTPPNSRAPAISRLLHPDG
jgi:transcriptional regulator with XRE-family HTH domain